MRFSGETVRMDVPAELVAQVDKLCKDNWWLDPIVCEIQPQWEPVELEQSTIDAMQLDAHEGPAGGQSVVQDDPELVPADGVSPSAGRSDDGPGKLATWLEEWLIELDANGFCFGGAEEAKLVLDVPDLFFWPLVLVAKRNGRRMFMVGGDSWNKKVALAVVVEANGGAGDNHFTFGTELLQDVLPM